ncbi:MAG: triose-phosphate isomerase [Pyrinomonadaceae bacterium]|nr:triose-phosphate isomerase [Pyrinomonadaceae bacterium]MCX7640975.1 triose-phosphate isomerase [Pyrinomonadaceae bacterium]MDW8305101.1 triose-phosphate isomerase [Acidobacteriota bacterium]
MRKPFIVGNWKMHKFLSDAVETAVRLRKLCSGVTHCDIAIAPVFVHLKVVGDRLEGSNIFLAAQNCSTEMKHAAHTGEVAASMLKDVGVSYVIIGHSERRQYYAETDEMINKKVKAALYSGLNVILCVGETLSERDDGQLFDVVRRQLKHGLEGLSRNDIAKVSIAYEPVWAIGTGRTATPEQAQQMHEFIRGYLGETHGEDVAERVRILYGGSVKPENVSGLLSQRDIDGALVGGASLDADTFFGIISYEI